MASATTIRTLVLVEADRDAAAVRAPADLVGRDPGSRHVQVRSAAGVTNFSRLFTEADTPPRAARLAPEARTVERETS